MAGDLPHTYKSINFGIQQRNMVKVSNPFVVELDASIKGLKDELKFSLSTLCSCHVVVVWGPNIQALHALILHPGREVRKKILSNLKQTTDLDSLHYDTLQFQAEGKYAVALPCPENVTGKALGKMPRSRYPVAIFVFSPENRNHETNTSLDTDNDSGSERNTGSIQEDEETDNTIIGLFAIVHLKDEIVTKSSHIVAKYIKTAGIPIYSLQALFVSTGDESQQETSSSINKMTSSADQSSHSNSTHLRQRATSSSQILLDSCSKNQQQKLHLDPTESNLSAYQTTEEASSSGDKAMRASVTCSTLLDSVKKQDRFRSTASASDGSFKPSDKGDLPNDLMRMRREKEECGESEDDSHESCSKSFFESQGHEVGPKILPDCVVCQSQPAKCALLPCRHNCVCLGCLRLLDKCPMCRCALESFFMVTTGCDQCGNGEDEDGVQDSEDDDGGDEMMREIERQGVATRIENFFERVNQIVGFR